MADRLVAPVLVLLVLAVLGTGLVTWRADVHAREAARHQACLDEAQATALAILVAPAAQSDREKRLTAAQQLSQMIDKC
jgi:hypothetical protein